MKRRTIINLVGIDGSGKTTQAKILLARLQARGIKAGYAWCRWRPMLIGVVQYLAKKYWQHRAKAKLGEDKSLNHSYKEFLERKRRLFKNKLLRHAWLVIFPLEYAIQLSWEFLPKYIFYPVIITDRYLYDTAVDQGLNLHLPPSQVYELLDSTLLCLFPKPALVIYIKVKPETAQARKPSEELDQGYWQVRANYYDRLSRFCGFKTLEGEGTIEAVAEDIERLVVNWLGLGNS